MAVRVFCIIALRNEERFLPGFLHHIRDHVDGIVALDDGSTDSTLEILRSEPGVVSILREQAESPPHGNETRNRFRLITEAVKLGAEWAICADADERYEERFLRRLHHEAEQGERKGELVRFVNIINLWDSRRLYRIDGLCGPRVSARMFKLPENCSERPQALHKPWFPPELDAAPRAYMNANVYHLGMTHQDARKKRYEKFSTIDPERVQQEIGYDHLVNEDNISLRPILPWRGYRDISAREPLRHTLKAFVSSFRRHKDQTNSSGSLLPPPVLTNDTGREPREITITQTDFDDALYLQIHPDVRDAVENGLFASGWEHYIQHGYNEGRSWRKPELKGLDFDAIFHSRRG